MSEACVTTKDHLDIPGLGWSGLLPEMVLMEHCVELALALTWAAWNSSSGWYGRAGPTSHWLKLLVPHPTLLGSTKELACWIGKRGASPHAWAKWETYPW